jgi:hypothetical protein
LLVFTSGKRWKATSQYRETYTILKVFLMYIHLYCQTWVPVLRDVPSVQINESGQANPNTSVFVWPRVFAPSAAVCLALVLNLFLLRSRRRDSCADWLASLYLIYLYPIMQKDERTEWLRVYSLHCPCLAGHRSPFSQSYPSIPIVDE